MSNFPRNENSDFSFCQTLREESRLWEADGLLSPQQREAILQRYENQQQSAAALPTQQQDSAKQEFPLYIRVVLTLAVFLIGLAVFLLISFNWKFLPGAVKLSIVGGVLAAAHTGGFLLRRAGKKILADVAFFFTGIMFGVGIWQVGQVFHLPADFPMGIWLWALGTFLMAMVPGSTPLHLLSAALLTAWVIADVSGSMNPHLTSLPVFAILGISSGIQRQKPVAAYSYVLVLVLWWILQGIDNNISPFLPFHIAIVGLICMAVSALLKTYRVADAVLGRLGICLILGGLFALSFLQYWGVLLYKNYDRYYLDDYYVLYLFWILALPVIDYSILFVLFRLKNRKENLREKFRNNKVVTILTLSVFVLWVGSYFLSLLLGWNTGGVRHSYGYNGLLKTDPAALAGMFSVNVLIVMLTIWLIQTGLKRGRGDWFWSGVLFFLVWTVVRYIDLFSGFGGMLGAAGIFLICGLFMLGISYVWAIQTRKRAAENTVKDTAEIFETPSQPFPIPAWLIATGNNISRFWQSERNILTATVLVALIQFGILGAMIVNEMYPHRSGTTIYVTTMPVDPRDLFRGDYVILRYPFSNLTAIPNRTVLHNNPTEQTVFVTMQQDGELWKPTGVSRNRPKDGVFLCGVVKPYNSEIVYGIESCFVQEGTGKEIEAAMRRSRESVIVELTVAPNGKAAIKTVHVK